MVYNNFGCIESIALLYTLLSVFITGGYIGYNLIKDYYKSKISQEYTKKDMSAYSPYYVMHIKIKNLQNYVVNQDIVEHTKIIEQITANLLFKFNPISSKKRSYSLNLMVYMVCLHIIIFIFYYQEMKI